MSWEEKHTWLAAFWHLPLVKRARAVISDTALVVLIILCFKVVAIVMNKTGSSPELYKNFMLLKDFVFLVLYAVLAVHLLDDFGLFALIVRLYNWIKGKSNGSAAILVA